MPTEFTFKTAPGQTPLLEDPPCGCEPYKVEAFMDRIVAGCFMTMEEDGICALAVATGLALCAASLFNPVNYTRAPGDIVQRTCDVAGILEKIAKGMRARVGY